MDIAERLHFQHGFLYVCIVVMSCMPNGTAETTEDERAELSANVVLREGSTAGLAAGIAMGLVMSLWDPTILEEAIAALYGFGGSLLFGWVAHLVHSIVFGVLFALLLRDPMLVEMPERLDRAIVTGIVYGLLLAVIAAGIIMPMWLSAVGFENPPSIPNVSVRSVLWHTVYGVVLVGMLRYFWR